MLGKVYEKWGISDRTDFSKLTPEDYPILSDLYELIEAEYKTYDAQKFQLYTAELLQDILLGLHSMYLKDRANRSGTCWPGINTIAKDLHLSRSTVKRALDRKSVV